MRLFAIDGYLEQHQVMHLKSDNQADWHLYFVSVHEEAFGSYYLYHWLIEELAHCHLALPDVPLKLKH